MRKIVIAVEMPDELVALFEKGAVALLIPAMPEEYRQFYSRVSGIADYFDKAATTLSMIHETADGKLGETTSRKLSTLISLTRLAREAHATNCLLFGRIQLVQGGISEGRQN